MLLFSTLFHHLKICFWRSIFIIWAPLNFNFWRHRKKDILQKQPCILLGSGNYLWRKEALGYSSKVMSNQLLLLWSRRGSWVKDSWNQKKKKRFIESFIFAESNYSAFLGKSQDLSLRTLWDPNIRIRSAHINSQRSLKGLSSMISPLAKSVSIVFGSKI